MDAVTNIFSALDMRKRMLIGFALSLALVGLLFMSFLGNEGPKGLLYAGLDEASSGEVITALETQGVAYEIRGNSIFVPMLERDSLRMKLASTGVPRLGEKGYELLDDLSGFGTTSQMFNAAYWRAKEGELARTILEAAYIKSARVHISSSPERAFQKSSAPTASVTVSTTSGALSMEQASALRHLVAGAVTRLEPRNVAIIDKVAGLIADESSITSGGNLRSAEAALQHKVQRLLEARVGPNNAVVEVSLEVVTQSETYTESRIDPSERVAISEDTQERTASDQNGAGGDVTVASNLPDGETSGAQERSSQNAETRQRTNYEVSQIQRRVSKQPGDIRRLSVAVLLNTIETQNADGQTQKGPRPVAELERLKALIETAVGFQADRGDTIAIESMDFQPTSELGSYAGPSEGLFSNVDIFALVQYVVGAIVLLILGLFVVKPILMSAQSQDLNAVGPAVVTNESNHLPSLLGPSEDSEDDTSNTLPELSFASPEDFGGFATAPEFAGDFMGDNSNDDQLKNLVTEKREEALHVLKSWLDASEAPKSLEM